MRKLYKHERIDKIVIVSGDGDYFRLVKFLNDENKLEKIIFPSSKNWSSLYYDIELRKRMFLDRPEIMHKIGYEYNRNTKKGG